jgi:hypothetical protein
MMGRKIMEEKVYQTPEIIYEGELEVHAGSPVGEIISDEDEILGGNILDLGGP